MPFRQTTVAGLPALSLQNETIELVALPSAGARISHLRRRRGREWLWRNPALPFTVPPVTPPASPTAYVDRYDSGGWDECFPTVESCPLPGAASGTPPLPDHGELWFADWHHDLLESRDRTTWRSASRCQFVPAEFQREVSLEGDTIHFEYRLRSLGSAPFPWLWAAHPLFTIQPGTSLELPGVSRARVALVHGRHDLAAGEVLAWPPDGGAEFVVPESGGWAMKLFLDAAPAGLARLTDPTRGETLELQWDAASLPALGIWLNLGGWGPADTPYLNLAIEPCITASDRLDTPPKDGPVAPFLPPQGERVWRLTVALREGDR